MISEHDPYDIAFIGHVCFDEVIPYQGAPRVAPGSAVLCGGKANVTFCFQFLADT
jgi:hypothetical protein